MNPVPLYNLPVTLTKQDLAKVMRRSVRWIERRLATGQLPIPRLKNHPGVLFSRDSVMRWLNDETFAPNARRSA